MKFNRLCAVFFTSAGLLFSGPAMSAFTLDFEGVGDYAAINDFYNGGTDSLGNSGTNYGVSFSSTSLGLVDADAGGNGNFANEPSAQTVLFWLNANSAILNMAAGFDTGFSFWYTSSTDATVNVYDAVGGSAGSGSVIGSINLSAQYTGNNCSGDPTGDFCNWTAAGVSFTGIAYSIDFGGTANYTGYDNVTFGSASPTAPVPEPEIYAMLGVGLGLMGWIGRRRKLQLEA